MSIYRSLAKVAHDIKPSYVPTYYAPEGKFGHVPFQFPKPSPVAKLYRKFLKPAVVTFVNGPLDRWQYAATTRHLRKYGLLFDDMYSERVPIIERATGLLPPDLAIGRLRRQGRAAHLSFLKLHMPIEQQNYDPFVPYLAPYIEEAKFQMQEEDTLMAYHPWDRKMFRSGLSGWGEITPKSYMWTTD